jgi:hypothetical protein
MMPDSSVKCLFRIGGSENTLALKGGPVMGRIHLSHFFDI